MKRVIKVQDLIAAMLSLVLFISANTVFWQAPSMKKMLQVVVIIVCLLAILFSVIGMKNAFPKSILIFLLCYLIATGVQFIYNKKVGGISSNSIISYLIIPITFLLWFTYDYLVDQKPERIFLYFRNIVVVYCSIELIVYLIIRIFNIGYNTSITINWGSLRAVNGYFGLVYDPQGYSNFLGFGFIRNSGFFTESPMFSFVISVSLLITLFLDKWITKKQKALILLVLIPTLFTTTSTGGLIAAILALYLVAFKNTRGYKKIFFLLVVPLVVIILVYIYEAKVANSAGSIDLRQDDIIAGFNTWKAHPILGAGWSNNSAIISNMAVGRVLTNNTGLSSGLFAILPLGGLYQTLLLYVIPYVSYSLKTKNWPLPLILFVILFYTVVNSVYLMISFSMYFYVLALLKNKQ